MGNYNLPRYGRVAIVDDNREEVEIVQRVFAEQGIPYIFYYYPEMREDKQKQADGIRLLFLDVMLEEGAYGEDNILSTLRRTIESVIPANNGPYAIILWTDKPEWKEEVINYMSEKLCDEKTTKPTFIEAIDKNDFATSETTGLIQKLNVFYEKQNMLAFLMEIENDMMSVPSCVLKSFTYRFISDFSNEELMKLLLRLAVTETGNCDSPQNATKTILRQIADLIRNRYMEEVANAQTVDKLASLWSFDFTDSSAIEAMDLGNNIEQIATFNTALNVNIKADQTDKVPGNVYIHSTDSLGVELDVLENSTFNDINKFRFKEKQTEYSLERHPIEIDITPSCDYAQGKNHMLRTVYGFIVFIKKDPDQEWIKANYEKKFTDQVPAYVYVSPVIKAKDMICVLLVNSKFLSLEKHEYCKDLEHIFRLNDGITNEIRKKVGDTISRLGITSIKGKTSYPEKH